MKITLKDVAKGAGVSIPTASRILSGKTIGKRSSKKEEVFKIAEEIGYTENIKRKRANSKQIVKIGLIVPRVGDTFFGRITQVISQILLEEYSYQVVINTSENKLNLEERALHLLLNQDIKGIIAVPDGKNLEHFKEVKKYGIPMVLFDIQSDELEADTITVDNKYGAYTAVKHLISYGHKNIGIVLNLKYLYTMNERFLGYKQALEEEGIPINESLIVSKTNRYERGYIETKYLLNSAIKPTSIFTANNIVTIGALQAIQEEGLRIPDDISLVGFDDFDLAPFLNPPLTVVSQPIEDIGKMAAKLIIERIENPNLEKKKIELKTKLIIRNSVKNFFKQL